jgi:hypothetical protein
MVGQFFCSNGFGYGLLDQHCILFANFANKHQLVIALAHGNLLLVMRKHYRS